MTPSIIRDFMSNKLTLQTLILEALTDLGGDLYGYKLSLEHQKRGIEVELINSLRDKLFDIRDTYRKTAEMDINKLQGVYDMFNIQLRMISVSKETAWERLMFTSYTNEFLGLIHLIKG